MVLERFLFFIGGKKFEIGIKRCESIWSKLSGLMFKKSSPALLFIFSKERELTIHSFFCAPFIAIWLDKNLAATKIEKIEKWGINFSGRGKYLLEIPSNESKNFAKLIHNFARISRAHSLRGIT
jgi:uncharacterized membrane protein (UPF0127 family)